jgi:hypothetical protein
LQRDCSGTTVQRRLLLQSLEVDMAIFQRCGKDVSLMVVSDLPSWPPPELLDAIRVGTVSGRVNNPQWVVQLGQNLMHRLGARLSSLSKKFLYVLIMSLQFVPGLVL